MLQLERSKINPILAPDESNWWESVAVFNCSVVYDGNTIHMLYRAVGEYKDYISRIGYASSNDGICFTRRRQVAISPEMEYERYGIEDPRLMTIENNVYLTYVVLSNYVNKNPSIYTALAKTNDFSSYERLGIITIAGSEDKDVVLFPKSGTGNRPEKYLMLHRPSKWVGPQYNTEKPSIWIAEGDSVTNFQNHLPLVKPEQDWETLKIGVGVPPIRTKKGWLVIYHGVSTNLVYSAGAFLLDLQEPRTILGRTKTPILTPEEDYETNGDVNNVVFPTGSCILDNKLFVYYGAADKVCCVATVDLDSFLDFLLSAVCSP